MSAYASPSSSRSTSTSRNGTGRILSARSTSLVSAVRSIGASGPSVSGPSSSCKAIELSGGSTTCTANLARAYAASGKRNEAARLLSELEQRSRPGYSSASEIATIYAALGDTDRAMTWLEKGFDERFNPGVLLRPGFDPLRSDRRFQDLVRRVGLTR